MADIANTLRGWSATAGSNQPTDSTTIGSGLDDNLRQLQAVVRQFLASYGTSIASAATMDLSTMDARYASVTGNTTVTGLGAEAAGIPYTLAFASTPMFKNSATLLLGGVDITFAAGDVAEFVSEGAGTWRMTDFLPTGGVTGTGGPVRAVSPTFTGTPIAPTAAAGTNTTQIATTAFISSISSPTVQRYTSTGANAWAKPANLKHIIVECVGGGGGGGVANSGSGTASAGGGGGGGGYVRKIILASSLAASVTATVGAGGGSATSGGLSAFQGFCTAGGGTTGTSGGQDQAAQGGAAGLGVNGDINAGGGTGLPGFIGVGFMGGQGASSIWGGGGRPAQGAGSAGGNADLFGAGGGGACDTTGLPKSGGSGSNGIVVVTEFYT